MQSSKKYHQQRKLMSQVTPEQLELIKLLIRETLDELREQHGEQTQTMFVVPPERHYQDHLLLTDCREHRSNVTENRRFLDKLRLEEDNFWENHKFTSDLRNSVTDTKRNAFRGVMVIIGLFSAGIFFDGLIQWLRGIAK